VPKYKVRVEFRRDTGTGPSSLPTHTGTIQVHAPNEGEARLRAIDEVYKEEPVCSHVRPVCCALASQPEPEPEEELSL
jgi:hypothetical protein